MLNMDAFQGGLTAILNWASLVFTSPANLLVPFILFIVSKRHLASAVLDGNIPPETHPLPEVGVPLTPVRLTTASEQAGTSAESIPVVIITDSTNVGPDMDEAKTKEPGEMVTPTSDVIPVPISNRVLSPSKHRYYGQEVPSGDGESSTGVCGTENSVLLETVGKAAAPTHNRRRPSLSISLSHSRSIMRSSCNTGMDEFLLISPTSSEPRSHGGRTVHGTRNPQPNVSTGVGSNPSLWSPGAAFPFPCVSSTLGECHLPTRSDSLADVRLSMPTATMDVVQTFKAFPSLSPTSSIRSTRISAIGCLLAAVIVLTAIVYDVVQDVDGGLGG